MRKKKINHFFTYRKIRCRKTWLVIIGLKLFESWKEFRLWQAIFGNEAWRSQKEIAFSFPANQEPMDRSVDDCGQYQIVNAE